MAGLLAPATVWARLSLPDHFHLGELLRETQSGDPVPHYKAAIAFEPGHVPSLMRLGEHYRSSNHLEMAEVYFTWCIALFPQRSNLYDLRGRLYLEIGEPEKAMADFRRFVEFKGLDPDSWRLLERRGSAYRALERYPEAIEDLTAALDRAEPHERGCGDDLP